MRIETIPVTPFVQNARIVFDPNSGKGALIDPGGEVDKILETADSLGAKIEKVVMTHAHIDHVGGVARVMEKMSTPGGQAPELYGHRLEKDMRGAILQQAMFLGLGQGDFENAPEPDVYLEENDIVEMGGCSWRVLFTPGHSPGHISLFCEDNGEGVPVLLAGDTLFSGSIGRTDLPGGDADTLFASIREKILTLPAQTIVMSGHGPDTTVQLEVRTNPFLR